MKKDKKVCCICGKEFTEYGNDPYPVKEDGECCRSCNWGVVIPKRIELSTINQDPRNYDPRTGKNKAYILEQTEGMAENAKIELLDALAWWASEEAGSLNFESPDAEDYE